MSAIMPEVLRQFTPQLLDLCVLLENRFGAEAESAGLTQPEFKAELRSATMALERGIHAADFERMDVDVPGIVVDGGRSSRF